MSYLDNPPIAGTILFDGKAARKGYGLNKMCYSLNEQAARDEFAQDEMQYCDKYGLTDAPKAGDSGPRHSRSVEARWQQFITWPSLLDT